MRYIYSSVFNSHFFSSLINGIKVKYLVNHSGLCNDPRHFHSEKKKGVSANQIWYFFLIMNWQCTNLDDDEDSSLQEWVWSQPFPSHLGRDPIIGTCICLKSFIHSLTHLHSLWYWWRWWLLVIVMTTATMMRSSCPTTNLATSQHPRAIHSNSSIHSEWTNNKPDT